MINEKEILLNIPEADSDKNNINREKIELRIPYDMKSFWRSIDEKFFSFGEFSDPNEILHKIQSLEKYGKIFYIF